MSNRSAACLVLVPVLVSAAMGCVATSVAFPAPAGTPLKVAGDIGIAYRYPEKKSVRYAFRMRMTTQGEARATENAEGFVHIVNHGASEGDFTRLRIRRQETKRRRVEVARRVESIDTAIRDVFPPLSPNVIRQDPADIQFTFPVDVFGRFAVKQDTPFHYMFYDSLCYFMPAFDKKGAETGQSWRISIPVILGFRYASNEFTIKADHRIDEIMRLANGHRAARVSVAFAGRFDTAEDPYAVRFSDAVRSEQRIVNSVAGTCDAVFDLDMGLLLWKAVSFKVIDSRSHEKTVPAGVQNGRKVTKTVWDTNEVIHEIQESWRYVPPEEALPVR
ncbi:MAG: hypothetical protein JW909_06365 [Planctomycetes bacterium]|nr:hypothetical protein [Planctomycetota bacterium]